MFKIKYRVIELVRMPIPLLWLQRIERWAHAQTGKQCASQNDGKRAKFTFPMLWSVSFAWQNITNFWSVDPFGWQFLHFAAIINTSNAPEFKNKLFEH